MHFVSLENNKMFLLVSTLTRWEDVDQECRHHVFCQENVPQKVVFSTVIGETDRIDDWFILFQDLFGHDDVAIAVTQTHTSPCDPTM